MRRPPSAPVIARENIAMVAETLMTDSLVPLRTSDTGEDALGLMNDFYLKHLPIVNNEELLGLLSEDDVLNNNVDEAVGSYQLSLHNAYAFTDDHIYEVMRQLAEKQLTVIPVINREQTYVGMITQEDLLNYFARTGSFTEPGSIIVLEMQRRDYSLAELARLVESENAAVLSSFISSDLNSSVIHVTLKINRQNIQGLLATFERFSYEVKASFNEGEYLQNLKDRYDSLMTYLNV